MTATTLADRMGRLGTETAFEVLARAKAIEAAGGKVIHLEIGEPDFPTPNHIVEAAVEALRSGQTHYVPAPGIPLLREAVAAFLERTGRMRVAPDRVIVTPGAKPIMFFAIMALCNEGDEVLYPDPGFPMYESITAMAGATPVPIPLREANSFRVDVDELAGLITDRSKLLIINSPHRARMVKNMIGLAPGVTTTRSGVVFIRPVRPRKLATVSRSGGMPGAGT